jgi:hypothetical protein
MRRQPDALARGCFQHLAMRGCPAVAPGERGSTGTGALFPGRWAVPAGQPDGRACSRLIATVISRAHGHPSASLSRSRRLLRARRAEMANRRRRNRFGSQRLAWPARASICAQASSSQARATISHHTWFCAKPFRWQVPQSGVLADQDLPAQVTRELRDREPRGPDVVSGCVRPGVPGPELDGQRLPVPVRPVVGLGGHRMMAEPPRQTGWCRRQPTRRGWSPASSLARAGEAGEHGALLIRGQFTVANLTGLPLPDGCIDLIVLTASLHDRTDVGVVIVSLDRALRPYGRPGSSNT